MVWLLSFTRFASLTKRIALIVAVEARLRVISPPVMTAATVANGRIGFGIIFVCVRIFSGAIFQTVGVHEADYAGNPISFHIHLGQVSVPLPAWPLTAIIL